MTAPNMVPSQDPLLLILNAVVTKYLQTLPKKELILTNDELKGLVENFTVRFEILNMTDPATSPVKLTMVTVEQASKMFKDMNKIVEHKRKGVQ